MRAARQGTALALLRGRPGLTVIGHGEAQIDIMQCRARSAAAPRPRQVSWMGSSRQTKCALLRHARSGRAGATCCLRTADSRPHSKAPQTVSWASGVQEGDSDDAPISDSACLSSIIRLHNFWIRVAKRECCKDTDRGGCGNRSVPTLATPVRCKAWGRSGSSVLACSSYQLYLRY